MPEIQPPGEEELRARLRAAGFDPDTVAASLARPEAPTVAHLMPQALTALKAGPERASAKTWGPYLQLLIAGLPKLCPCPCEACATKDCRCAPGPAGHTDACRPPADVAGLDCAERYRGVGELPVEALRAAHIEAAARWCEIRGSRRTVARNAARRTAKRVLLVADGRGAREQCIQACRWFGEWLRREGLATDNVARQVKLPARLEAEARALTVAEFGEVYRVAITTGTDPELDGLVLRHLLIHAQRRGALLGCTAGSLDVEGTALRYYDKKRKQWRKRPSTPSHVADLVAHVLERGPRVPAPPEAPAQLRRTGLPAVADADPLFYLPPHDTFDADGFLLARTVRPMGRKRIEGLFARIRRRLPWADRRGLRCHDIRHTSARLVYEAGDAQLARLHLGHDAGSTTDHYLTAQLTELAALKRALFEPPDP